MNTPNFSWGMFHFYLLDCRHSSPLICRSSLARHSRREWRAREEKRSAERSAGGPIGRNETSPN